VAYNGRRVGSSGSKLEVINYTNSLTIMQVDSNLPDDFAGSAVIENLVIDGNDASGNAVGGVTGLLLENVYNCVIRNITIRNCEVGIRVKLTGSAGDCSRGNRFEHIRMKNVKTGIVFEGVSAAKDFSYTTIDDVRISLDNRLNGVGIKIGDDNVHADLHCAFIKATVWLGNGTQKGLEVNGVLKYSLVNFEVEQEIPLNPLPSGWGVYVNLGATVWDNQNFLLTTLGLVRPINNVLFNHSLFVYSGVSDIDVRSS